MTDDELELLWKAWKAAPTVEMRASVGRRLVALVRELYPIAEGAL